MPKRHFFNYVLIAIFLAGISLPLMLTSRKGISEIEKRRLANFPGIPHTTEAILKFPRGFDAFFNDHFGFRESLVYLHNVLHVRLGVSPTEKVVIGKDGWFFYAGLADGNETGDYRRVDPLTGDELAAWEANLVAKHDWLKAQGIDYLFVIVPNKTTVYGEHLPATIIKGAGPSRADQLMAHMASHPEVSILDLRPVMLAAKSNGPLLYDKTGTHWNAWGANIAQYAIAGALAERTPSIKPVLFASADFREQWGAADTDLTRMMAVGDAFNHPSPALTVSLPECSRLEIDEKSSQSSSEPPFQTLCPAADGADVLIFRDSAFIALQPYVSSYFQRATYVWIDRPDLASVQAYVQATRPQIVIEERGERHLKETGW